jgi:biopolymer transport protein ExbD
VNGARTEKEGLQDEIEVYLPQDTERAGRTVVIYADRDAQYATVATAIEAVNKADAYLELAVIKD